MNDRLRLVRKSLRMTQEEFGRRVGVKGAAISKLESGDRNLTDQMAITLCREFRINETWLRTGEGEMFTPINNGVIAQLAKEYDLDEISQRTLEIFINLPPEYQRTLKAVARYLLDEAKQNGEYRAEWNNNLTEEEAVALTRQRYADFKKGGASSTTSVSGGIA